MKAFEQKSGLFRSDIAGFKESARVSNLIGWSRGASPFGIGWIEPRRVS
ncbi:MAG TPA: hypothetical protein VHZ03_41425 [Trebonia sp.]|jgi:hypothetical protein|nr:hypothetical protein [Trebonia sp.]